MMNTYKYDIHVHTKETSSCGEVTAAKAAELYHQAGYQGIMVSDHYHKQYFDSLGAMDIHEKIQAYLRGYRAAKAQGDRLGLDVILGIEFRSYETENDFLIIGITEEFLHDYPMTYELPVRQAIDLFHKHDLLVIQAHPVRFRMLDLKEGRLFNSYKNHEMLDMLDKNPYMGQIWIDQWSAAQKAGKSRKLLKGIRNT